MCCVHSSYTTAHFRHKAVTRVCNIPDPAHACTQHAFCDCYSKGWPVSLPLCLRIPTADAASTSAVLMYRYMYRACISVKVYLHTHTSTYTHITAYSTGRLSRTQSTPNYRADLRQGSAPSPSSARTQHLQLPPFQMGHKSARPRAICSFLATTGAQRGCWGLS